MKNKINIILILADEHRHDCLGAYGNKEIRTPNIDQIAKKGVIYQNAFCTYPICTPSRYSLLTGLYAHQHLGISNHSTIPKNLETLPKILKENGYNTTAIGKMHFTPAYLDIGFQKMYLAEQNGPGRYIDDYHIYLQNKNLIDKIDIIDQIEKYRKKADRTYWDNFGALKSNLAEEDYSTSWIAQKAIDEIEDWNSTGNFLMIGFIKPHHPFDPPYPWDEMYVPDNLKILSGWTEKCLNVDLKRYSGYFPNKKLSPSIMKKVLAYYYSLISQIDFYVGKIIDKLKEKKLYEQTLIIYTSDHGDYMGYHHMLLKGNFMYEPLIKIPLIVKYPYESVKGTSNKLVSSIDISKTILKQCNLNSKQFYQGIELNSESEKRESIYVEDDDSYLIRTERYKLIINQKNQNLMFDLFEDPFEMNNIYKEKRKIADCLKNEICNWLMFESKPNSYLDEKANIIYNFEERSNMMKSYIEKKLRNFNS